MMSENSDLLDEGLQAVMGKDRCQNEWWAKSEPAQTKEVSNQSTARKEDSQDASWIPVKTATELDKIVECVRHITPIVAMSGVVFWWQQSGQLAEATGFYALIVLALMTGLTAGKYLTR